MLCEPLALILRRLCSYIGGTAVLPERIWKNMEKLLIEKVPENRDLDGVKRWEEEKGEFVQIAYSELIRHLAWFTIRAGFWRGMHYHEKKEEIFYVIDGKMRAVFIDMDSKEREEHILEKGDRIRIQPRCWHIFYGLEDSSVVEYSPQFYDKTDAPKINLEK
jgi:dTDP-4-dehydrorhamnose 3,5-epimerase-like enzyme